MNKERFKSKDGWITSYSFRFFKRGWIISFSEKKWRKGDKYKRMPIWFSKVGENISAMFIWNVMIGLETRRNEG